MEVGPCSYLSNLLTPLTEMSHLLIAKRLQQPQFIIHAVHTNGPLLTNMSCDPELFIAFPNKSLEIYRKLEQQNKNLKS